MLVLLLLVRNGKWSEVSGWRRWLGCHCSSSCVLPFHSFDSEEMRKVKYCCGVVVVVIGAGY